MIIDKPIVLHLSEAEADVLQHALSMWVGPYGRPREELDPQDQPNHDRKTTLGIQMCSGLQEELTRRYEAWVESDEGRRKSLARPLTRA